MEITASFTPNTAKFFESYVNVPHSVLGVKLNPLSLLHYLWLHHLESPLITTGKEGSLADLELAALICSSSSSEEILRKINRKGFFAKVWRYRNRYRQLNLEALAFLAYHDDYVSLPLFGDTKGEEEKLPYLLLYAANLIKATGWSEEVVFTMPLGKLIWLNVAFSYLNSGKTNVISDWEQAATAALKALTPEG